MTKLHKVVRGVEVKEVPTVIDGDDIVHIHKLGYNSLAESEVVVDRDKVGQVIRNIAKEFDALWEEMDKVDNLDVEIMSKAIATAIEGGAIISLKGDV